MNKERAAEPSLVPDDPIRTSLLNMAVPTRYKAMPPFKYHEYECIDSSLSCLMASSIPAAEMTMPEMVGVESIVRVNQIQTISSKAIQTILKKRLPGGGETVVELSPEQLRHVEDLFRWQYLKEPLLQELFENHLKCIPTAPVVDYKYQLHRPVNYSVNSAKNMLWFKCHDDTDLRVTPLINRVPGLNLQEYNHLLRNLCSAYPTARLPAATQLHNTLNATLPGSQAAATQGGQQNNSTS